VGKTHRWVADSKEPVFKSNTWAADAPLLKPNVNFSSSGPPRRTLYRAKPYRRPAVWYDLFERIERVFNQRE
jgi:hypothetical protein